MSLKTSIRNFKELVNPTKNENLIVIEILILAILSYYDLLLEFPQDPNTYPFLIVFLIIYICLGFISYLMERRRMEKVELQTQFYLYSQMMISSFFGVLICGIYLALQTNEIMIYITALIPLLFLGMILLVYRITLYEAVKFLKWMIDAEVWQNLDDQTIKDFKQAETSMRNENVINAIINICKGLERELKIAIFQPFKEEMESSQNPKENFKLLKPFKPDGSDPRQRTYQNFKNYLKGKRHLTFGNIPFFLLNLTDNKIGRHTVLFEKFSEFLKSQFQEDYDKVIQISKILFNHQFFTVSGIKISDLRNEAAHPQNLTNSPSPSSRSDRILSSENYLRLLKVMASEPNLLKLIVDLKAHL